MTTDTTRKEETDIAHLSAEISRLSRHLKRFVVPRLTKTRNDQHAVIERTMRIAHEAEETIKRQKAHIERLESQARTDDMTGLLNRRAFTDRIRETLADAERFDDEGLLIYIDLDNFKPVNDAFGHAAGDRILKHVAEALKKNVRRNDAVARIGGDEFAVLMPRSNHFNWLAQTKRLEMIVNTSCIAIDDQFISIQASFGVQPFTGDDEPNTIMARADQAMYRTKLERKGLPARTYAA